MSDTTPLNDDELMALWERARRMALARCSGSLRSLRQGDGGFYEADDFWQDLFLDFWDLVRRWRDGVDARHAGDLWAAWRRHLWQGGHRVLRRRPQRLWRRREEPVDPDEMALDGPPSEGAATPAAVPPIAVDALTESGGPEEASMIRAEEDAVESRLWRLAAINRQALYLTTVAGLSHAEAARCLALAGPEQVRRHVCRARESVRRGRRVAEAMPREDSRP